MTSKLVQLGFFVYDWSWSLFRDFVTYTSMFDWPIRFAAMILIRLFERPAHLHGKRLPLSLVFPVKGNLW